MADRAISPARTRLAVTCAKRIRKAAEQRDRQQRQALTDYDKAVAEGNEREITDNSLLLIIMLSHLVDPVANEISRYVEVDQMIQAAEGE